MQTIHKYPIPVTGSFYLHMPEGAEILSVQLQRGEPMLWAKVDPDAQAIPVRFWFVGTGHLVPDGLTYVGTIQLHDGDLVLHLFRQP